MQNIVFNVVLFFFFLISFLLLEVLEIANVSSDTKEKIISIDEYKTIYVGDSRMDDISKLLVNENIYFITKSGSTCDWLEKEAVKEISGILSKNENISFNIIINMGVNDIQKLAYSDENACTARDYAKFYSFLSMNYFSKHNLIVVSVNPIDEIKIKLYDSQIRNRRTNEKIFEFNKKLKDGLPSSVYYCDVSKQLAENGFDTRDGLHFVPETSLKTFDLMEECIKDNYVKSLLFQI